MLLLLPLLLLLCPDFVRGLTKFIAFYKHITNAQPARTKLFPLCPFVLGSSIPSSHIKARHVRWLSVGCPYVRTVRIVRIVRIVRSPAPLEPLLDSSRGCQIDVDSAAPAERQQIQLLAMATEKEQSRLMAR